MIDRDGLFEHNSSAILVPNSPFAYHLVDPSYGNLLNSMDASEGAGFLNRNGSSSVYPLVVVNSALTSGVLGQAQSLTNDGKAITIDAAQIAASATIVGLSSSTTYMAQVLAHEIGHKLGLKHYEIINPVDPNLASVQSSPGLLGLLNYAPASTLIDLYVWSPTYASIVSGQSKLLRANNVEVGVDDMLRLGTNNPTYVFAFSPMTTSAIVDFQVTGGALLTTPIQIRSNIANDQIMDWSTRLIPSNLLNPTFWHFNPTQDLPAMCLLRACPNPNLCFTASCSAEK